MPPPPEKRGFRLYREVLKDPKHVVAPMVDASELAWRMLGRVNVFMEFHTLEINKLIKLLNAFFPFSLLQKFSFS